ncbi:MAG: chemotaxis response regulator protein-glutamate methylesterase [Chloroflexi bacterium]|nr:chemotaxis response regulator protein-glutamate methylesterase [Chloroflexota bacterium]
MKYLIRVLVVDDSAFMRHTLAKHLEADPSLTVVGRARDGLEALEQIPVLKPDVVTLDVEMPRMDGLTALKHIMTKCPTPVIMLSAYTQQGARATIKALMRGAVDFVPKPDDHTNIQDVIRELVVKVKIAAITPTSPRTTSQSYPPAIPHPPTTHSKPQPLHKNDPLIIIGTSTGGPRALQQILSDLPADLPAAMVMVQHMPPSFTRALAQRLDENCALTIKEAQDGDRVARGLALLAPGNFHLALDGRRRVRLTQEPRRNGVRPSVDVSMETAVTQYGSAIIGVVLTGMGSDGTDGARSIKAAGGRIIAEHESTSAVYGMPRSVIEAGLADQVVPLPKVASTLVEWIK